MILSSNHFLRFEYIYQFARIEWTVSTVGPVLFIYAWCTCIHGEGTDFTWANHELVASLGIQQGRIHTQWPGWWGWGRRPLFWWQHFMLFPDFNFLDVQCFIWQNFKWRKSYGKVCSRYQLHPNTTQKLCEDFSMLSHCRKLDIVEHLNTANVEYLFMWNLNIESPSLLFKIK